MFAFKVLIMDFCNIFCDTELEKWLKIEIIPQSLSREQLDIQCTTTSYDMDTYLLSAPPLPPPPIGAYTIGVQLSRDKD